MKKVGDWMLPDCDVLFSKEIEKTGGFQLDRLDRALQYVTNWSCAVDGGAHVGIWTRALAERFDVVHAFEPAADSFACLRYNMWADERLGKVVTYNAAIGDEAGEAHVVHDPQREPLGNTGSRFVQKGAGEEEESVQMLTIDSLHLTGIGFMKLDVEGAELLALKGAVKTIEWCKPVVYVEVKKDFGERFGLEKDAPLRFLKELGAREVDRIKADHVFAF